MNNELKKLLEGHRGFERALRNDLSLLKQPAPVTVMVNAWPALVNALQAGNSRNRKPKKQHVSFLANLMRKNEWYVTGQGFSVDTNGENIDSGNRTAAIIEAGYPAIPFNLTLGVDRRALAYIDTHAKRSAADALTLMFEQTVQNWVAAVARYMVTVAVKGTKNDKMKPTAPQMATMLAAESDAMEVFNGFYRLDTNKAWTAPRIAAWLIFARMDLSKAVEVARAVQAGEMLQRDDPAMRLRNLILKSSHGGSTAQTASFNETISLMRAAFEGRSIAKVYPASALSEQETRVCECWRAAL